MELRLPAWLLPIIALGGIGAFIDFLLGKAGRDKVKQTLAAWWIIFDDVKWNNFGRKEALFAAKILQKSCGTLFSFRRMVIVSSFFIVLILVCYSIPAIKYGRTFPLDNVYAITVIPKFITTRPLREPSGKVRLGATPAQTATRTDRLKCAGSGRIGSGRPRRERRQRAAWARSTKPSRSLSVELRCGAVAVGLEHICSRPFRLAVPHWFGHGSVSTSRSSNRTGGFTASGSRTRRHAFTHDGPRPSWDRRTSPKCS